MSMTWQDYRAIAEYLSGKASDEVRSRVDLSLEKKDPDDPLFGAYEIFMTWKEAGPDHLEGLIQAALSVSESRLQSPDTVVQDLGTITSPDPSDIEITDIKKGRDRDNGPKKN